MSIKFFVIESVVIHFLKEASMNHQLLQLDVPSRECVDHCAAIFSLRNSPNNSCFEDNPEKVKDHLCQ